VRANADIPAGRLDELTPLTSGAQRALEGALEHGRLTARGLARVRRVARTLADLDGVDPAAPLSVEVVALAMTLRDGGGRHLESVA